jgi:signal transduction histidine kinase/CheY-like chemotaxis protein
MRPKLRSSHLVLLLGGFLVAAILTALGTAIWVAREQSIGEWRKQLSNLSLVLAEQTSQQVTSARLVLDSVVESVAAAGVDSEASLRSRMGTEQVYDSMRDKMRGLPQVDVVTIVAANGDVVNFTRSFPAPEINLADRDYFAAHLNDPKSGVYFSKPVRNRSNNQWSFYLSRRLTDRNGKFMGMVLVGLSSTSLSEFYRKISLGDAANVSLYRRDFTLLARWPQIDSLMGQANRGGSSYRVIEGMKKSHDVVITAGPRQAQGGKWVVRMGAPRLVGDYPLVINITITDELFLARWREFSTIRLLLGAITLGAVLLATVVLFRVLRRREHDLENTQRLKEEADAANQAKSDFLTMMSHEIRTPLTSIIGFAELLGTAAEPEVRREAGQVILRNGQHLLRIINDILDIAKIEAGRLRLEHVAFSPLETIWSIDPMMSAQAKGKGIGFDILVEYPFPAQVMGDPTRWKQILFNLCSNAIKFTEQGKVQLTLWYDRPARRLVCNVVDTGIGMSDQQVVHLFAPFAQADRAIARKYGGTGLGLHLVQQFATKMGGTVSFASELGKGSVFEVSIAAPMAKGAEWLASAPAPAPAASLPGAQPAAPRRALRGRVLLAEDGPDNRKLISSFLGGLKLDFIAVEDGAQAVRAALGEPFDLILMDMQMPVMDGLRATEVLRASGFAGPIVALTANVMPEDVQRYLRGGCSHCVGKPVDFGALAQLLAALLGQAEAAAAPQPSMQDLSGFEEIRLSFAASLGPRLDQLRRFMEAAAWADAQELAHTLKGSAGSFGYPELTLHAGGLEQALRRADHGAALAALDGLLALDELREIINDFNPLEAEAKP